MRIRVIDTETTGLPPDCKIVEIATVDLVLTDNSFGVATNWVRDRMWSTLVNPGIPIPPEASAIHHITDDMVAGKPTIGAALGDACRGDVTMVRPGIFAAHEAKFEMSVLPRFDDPNEPPTRWICTRKCAATFWPDAPNHKNQTLRYWLGLKLADPSLAEPHRALGDAYVTAAILRRLIKIATVDELVDISSKPVLLQKFSFGKHAMQPMTSVPTGYLEWIIDKSQIDDEDVCYTAQQNILARRRAHSDRDPLHKQHRAS